MEKVTITIANKCRLGSNGGAIRFSTKNGKQRFFTLPYKHIDSWTKSKIKINKIHDEPATKYTITLEIYERLKESMQSMMPTDIILPKT